MNTPFMDTPFMNTPFMNTLILNFHFNLSLSFFIIHNYMVIHSSNIINYSFSLDIIFEINCFIISNLFNNIISYWGTHFSIHHRMLSIDFIRINENSPIINFFNIFFFLIECINNIVLFIIHLPFFNTIITTTMLYFPYFTFST